MARYSPRSCKVDPCLFPRKSRPGCIEGPRGQRRMIPLREGRGYHGLHGCNFEQTAQIQSWYGRGVRFSRFGRVSRPYHWRMRGHHIMPLVQLVMVLIVVGVLLWLVNRFIPMAGSIKSILNAVVVIVVVLWLLNVFGVFHSMPRMYVAR